MPLSLGILVSACAVVLALLLVWQLRRQQVTMARLRNEAHRRDLAEQALRQSQKMEAVGRLTGGIAHDFNNHLTVISSNVELLQRRLPPGSDSLARLTDGAMAGVQRAAALTHRLLALSRQQPLDPEPLDIGKLVAGMSDLLRRTLGESITIEIVSASGLWLTRADANQLENVLLNLAVNARNSMQGGGRLTIETANAEPDQDAAIAGEYVMLAVNDTGSEGAPLSLAMVDEFARESGGSVAITNTPGQGNEVRLYLPRFARQEDAARPPVRIAEPERHGRGQTILVVEDDAEVRRVSAEALREIGYEVLEAGDAMDGVRLIVDHGGIDLLFTDVGLPGGVNGRELADAARSARPGLRVLFTTGKGQGASLLDSTMHLIAKPFDLSTLAAKIHEVLQRPSTPKAHAGAGREQPASDAA
jgi:CheY-like chemotaxis protein